MTFKIYDQQGVERDAEWLHAKYGPVNVRVSSQANAFRVVELRECIGPADLLAIVLDRDGMPIEGEIVARHWPYREWNPELLPLPENEWFTTGVYGPTEEGGKIGFATGGGDYYLPEEGGVGASSIWVLESPSDCIENLGSLGWTEHAHIDTVFRWVEGQTPEPEPEPGECPDLSGVISKLDLITAELGEAIKELKGFQV